MGNKPLLIITDTSADPEHARKLQQWVEEVEAEGWSPWDQYEIVLTDDEMDIAEVPALDEFADELADRVAERLAEPDDAPPGLLELTEYDDEDLERFKRELDTAETDTDGSEVCDG